MKQLLIVIAGLFFFIMLTGAILPSLISTDKLPIMIILLLLASLAFAISAIILKALRKINKSKDEENDKGI
jgi:hypothetical protein